MFDHLMDFSYQRSGREVFGFYLAYMLPELFLTAAVGEALGSALGLGSFGVWFFATAVAVICQLSLGGLILQHKESNDNIQVLVVSLALTLGLGTLGGMAPIASLTRRETVPR